MTNQQTPAFVLDESRYAGHTPASQWVGPQEPAKYPSLKGFYADADLGNDAPQLLAEALRLRAVADESSRLAAERLAENERLRLVLEVIATKLRYYDPRDTGQKINKAPCLQAIRDVALEALADTTQSDTQGDGRGDG